MIKHGIYKNKTDGLITVSGKKESDNFVLQVTDNGKGMESDQVEYLNRTFSQMQQVNSDGKGFRFLNVHQRIRLNYEGKYGLVVESVWGEGTTVSVTIPPLA